MRRIVLLLLLFVLPLQFGLSAVVDARLHADDVQHHATSPLVDANLNVTPESKLSEDATHANAVCDACHFCHTLAFFSECAPARQFAAASDLPLIRLDAHASTTVLDRPLRPKWMFPV